MPSRGSDQAAGLDLTSVIETMVPPRDSVLIKTGLAIELPPGTNMEEWHQDRVWQSAGLRLEPE